MTLQSFAMNATHSKGRECQCYAQMYYDVVDFKIIFTYFFSSLVYEIVASPPFCHQVLIEIMTPKYFASIWPRKVARTAAREISNTNRPEWVRIDLLRKLSAALPRRTALIRGR